MNDSVLDIQSARNLFSKTNTVSFGFISLAEHEQPVVTFIFRNHDLKQASEIFLQLCESIDTKSLQLSILENGGDYLTISMLWKNRSILFSSTPDYYSRKEFKQFRSVALYGDTVKICFAVKNNDTGLPKTITVPSDISADLYATYYEYIP